MWSLSALAEERRGMAEHKCTEPVISDPNPQLSPPSQLVVLPTVTPATAASAHYLEWGVIAVQRFALGLLLWIVRTFTIFAIVLSVFTDPRT